MIGRARENWRRFKESKPGHRFQDHYRHQQQGSSARSNLQVILSIVGGFLVVGGGIIAVPGPGPGWLIILLGLGMIAGVSLSFASFIDRVEVKLRGLARWGVGKVGGGPLGGLACLSEGLNALDDPCLCCHVGIRDLLSDFRRVGELDLRSLLGLINRRTNTGASYRRRACGVRASNYLRIALSLFETTLDP